MKRLLTTGCLLVVAVAEAIGVALPVTTIDNPQYAFNFAVSDTLTKDNKAQWEVRDGGAVKGSYYLVEPDGSLRVVDYAADELTGFNAVVKKVGAGVHPTPVIAPITPAKVAAASFAQVAPIAPVAPIASVASIASVTPIAPVAPINVPAIDVPITPIVADYGVAPLPLDLPKVTNLGQWSLPWDPFTGSYGGWVPLKNRLPPATRYVTIFSKKLVNGKWYRSITGPVPLFSGTKLVFKKKN